MRNGEARPAFCEEEEENSSSSDDEEEEEEITPVENRTMMMNNNTHNAHEQTAFAPWARYQLNYPSL
jgi:hypothetical protein